MMNKIYSLILFAFTVSMADFYYSFPVDDSNEKSLESEQNLECSDDVVDLSIQKRNLAKKFEECSDKRTDYSVSILFFKVAEGEYGESEEAQCFKEYMDKLKPLATCIKTKHSNTTLFSTDEKNSYLFYWGVKEKDSKAFNEVLRYMHDFKTIDAYEEGKTVLDPFNTLDEEYSLKKVSLEDFEKTIAEFNGSREDKDVLRLYFKYVKSKYNWVFRCNIKPAFICDTSWLGEEKEAFLKKYPESEYREFIETQMPLFAEKTDEEMVLAKAEEEKIDRKLNDRHVQELIAERNVWIALSGMALFGIPVTSTTGFDDNFDVSSMFGIALKANYRFFAFQYQYNFAFGDNNKGGSIAEKSYSLMGGLVLGPQKTFTVDLLFGVSYIDTYPKDEHMPRANLDYSSWALAIQANYYFPIADSWDVVAHFLAKMNYMENYCRDNFVFAEDDYVSCRDPYSSGSTGAMIWEDMQWTFSLGVGIRFWKPKPLSLYHK